MPTIKTTNPYAEVELVTPQINGRDMETRQVVMVKDDEGVYQESGVVSKGYQLIKNELAHGILEDIVTRSGEPFHDLRGAHWDGKRYVEYKMSDRSLFEVQRNGVNRTAKIGIALQNSYDGSCALRVQMFIALLECSNQCIESNLFGSFSLKHQIGGNGEGLINVEDAVSQIGEGAQRLIAAAPVMERLGDIPLTLDMLKLARRETKLAEGHWGRVIDRTESDTAWGLYNALTSVASHDVAGNNGLTIGNNIGRLFLAPQSPVLALAA